MNMIEDEVLTENKYEERIKAFADKMEATLNELHEKRKDVEDSAKEKIDEGISAIRERRNEFLAKVQDLRDASGEEWDKYSEKVDNTLGAIENEIDTASSGIKNGMSYLFDKFRS